MRSLRFIINPRSGGQQGHWLRRQLALRFPSAAIVDLPGGDLAVAVQAAADGGAALVACGGDGTAAAALDAAWLGAGERAPVPVGVVPLGTGNDLARSLGWGGRAPGASDLDGLLTRLQHARAAPHDRWVLDGPGIRRAWFNYCSIGLDARVALRFHRLREGSPWLFRGGPAANKALYGIAALGEHQLPLGDAVVLDGAPLPRWTRALVMANIGSYAGGSALAPDISPVDGHLDAFAFGPGAGLGLGLSGARRPRRVACRDGFALRLGHPLAMQVDGEPFIAAAGDYRIRRDGLVRVLASR